MPRIIKHYPTPSTTTYYVDEFLIDDIFRVDFQRKATEQPIWGYASRNFDFVARGREIVTGNIIINFRYPGYLRNIIELKKNGEEVLTKSMIESRLIDKNYDYQDEKVLENYNDVDSTQHKMNILSDLATSSLDQKSNTSDSLWKDSILQAKNMLIKRNIQAIAYDNKKPPISSMASPLDGGNGAHPFDMTVRYGFQGVAGGFVRRFEDIILIGESQVVQASAGRNVLSDTASSAQSLLEVYPFFCKRILVENYNG